MSPLSPATDTAIARKYGVDSLELKAANKVALQEDLGWAPEPKRPMLCLPTGITEQLGGELLQQLMEGLLSLPIEIVVLGKGTAAYGEYLSEISKNHSHRVAIIPNEDTAVRRMLAASDMALFLADASDTPELTACLRYAAVPICLRTKSLLNYDPNQESGNAFLYDKENVWSVFAAVVRALETYRFPFDWKTIQKHCMSHAA